MENPYRIDCQKCVELELALTVSKNELANEKQARQQSQRSNSIAIGKNILFGLAILSATCFMGFWAHAAAMKPDRPAPCQDAAEIITHENSVKVCHPDAAMTVERLNVDDKMIYRCVCPRPVK